MRSRRDEYAMKNSCTVDQICHNVVAIWSPRAISVVVAERGPYRARVRWRIMIRLELILTIGSRRAVRAAACPATAARGCGRQRRWLDGSGSGSTDATTLRTVTPVYTIDSSTKMLVVIGNFNAPPTGHDHGPRRITISPSRPTARST